MIKCLAIDDEPLALRQLESYISKVPFLELVGSCGSTAEARKKLDEEDVSAIFVDINMPDENGMDFVRSLSAPPMVVFTTAYSDYAVEGFKVNAVDFLLKPFGKDEFQIAANKLKEAYELRHQDLVVAGADDDAIFVKTEYMVMRIKIEDIRYVEAMSEYLRLYVEGEERPIITLLSMRKMEEFLSSRYFMRIHRSYIINLKKIRVVEKGRVSVDGQTFLPVGDMYKSIFQQYINSRLLTK